MTTQAQGEQDMTTSHETGVPGVRCSTCASQCEACARATRVFNTERIYTPAEYWRDQYVGLRDSFVLPATKSAELVHDGQAKPAKPDGWMPDNKSVTGKSETDDELRERVRPSILHVSAVFVPEAQKKIKSDLDAATGQTLEGMAAMVALERRR